MFCGSAFLFHEKQLKKQDQAINLFPVKHLPPDKKTHSFRVLHT
jgi:hypothetical protein